MPHPPLILASASPNRAVLLNDMGLQYTIVAADVAETSSGEPRSVAVSNAALKADAVRLIVEQSSNTQMPKKPYILAADTIVVLDGEIYGKPKDNAHAAEILAALQGRTHEVITGVCVAHDTTIMTEHDSTHVTIAPMTSGEIRAYIRTGEALGRAGAYAIQGSMRMFVKSIQGNYDNVVGLPTCLVRRMLTSMGFEWLDI